MDKWMMNVDLSTLLLLLHQKKLFEQKFVLLSNIILFFNGSTAILPSSESWMMNDCLNDSLHPRPKRVGV
jgi:hypothetical protein